ncbi:oxidoreductase [Anaerotignum faecicola]|uniref:Oxidoreductase n=1 Tax=Anaerotignum faecicola TaxID=2358141 RepID=A0A401LCS7_9FIRM|nr:FAD-dependent oxidoreductase [Anaerotignum faecicola]GCB29339.1 oxidoreductase [Anaerotignum faecicola]
MKFEAMFQPIQIGPMTVANRFVMSPMGNNFANTDGTMSERSASYYGARAKGGFGLITFEATVVYKEAKGGPRKPCLYDDSTVSSFQAAIAACHQAGAKVSIQLQHAGPEGNTKITGYPLKAASAIPASCGRETPEAITKEELYRLIECYGDAAVRAKKAGADAVEIHCAHGYLVSTFISARTNKRVDEFGGSFENRMRLPKLIIENIRKKAGDSLAILCRINATDDVEGGQTAQDAAAVASYLEKECGVDGLHLSRAVHLHDECMWAPSLIHGGFSADYVTEIKRAVSVPIITVGRYTEPQFAELMIAEGRADLVAFGRQSIADPEMPNKAKAGRLDLMNPCIGCLQGCVPNMFKGEPITCLVNPLAGREADFKPAQTKKNVMVIGGGPGGLYAAFTAAQRGHAVALYEKGDILGGNMRLAAYPPGKGDITNMVRSYIAKCEEYGVKMVMNTEVTPAMVAEAKPDAVIVATGSNPLVLPIPGINDTGVIHAGDLLDGKAAVGKKVLVVGGGMVGCEVADFLGELGHEVSVIELRDQLGPDVIPEHRKFLMKDFDTYKVQGVTGAKVAQFFTDGVSYTLADGTEGRLEGFDNVVLAMGYRNNDTISEEIKKIVAETYVIGDAVKARKALDATAEGLNAALEI